MIKTLLSAVLLLTINSGFAQNFGGNPTSVRWKKIEGKNVRVIFPAGLDSQANRVLQVNKLLDTTTLSTIGNKMSKWNIVLQNKTTVSNAYVRLAPRMSEYYLMPEQDNFSNGSLRWDDNLAIHENRHMQQFSNFNKGLTKVFSAILGQEGQLLANGITIPDYFFEGDAVYQETLVSQQGRGRLPSFYNGIKSLWLQEENYSWMKLRSGSLKDYTPGHYEVGYLLTAYGYEKYGEGFWRKVTDDAVRFKGLFYAFPNAIKRHSGVSYKKFREDALAYFKVKLLPATMPEKQENFITPVVKDNVISYTFPAVVGKDSLLVTKSSYKEINSFYFIINGKEEKLRVKDYVLDDYFSYRNGKVVYSAYRSDRVRTNVDFSDIRILDIHTNEQRNLTTKTKYFSPEINEAGTKVIAVNVNEDGSNSLHVLDAGNGAVLQVVPNENNYFYTQTKFINDNEVISAIRNPEGQMALAKTTLQTGQIEILTSFSYDVVGYPFIQNDTIYYSRMHSDAAIPADRIFGFDLLSKKNFQLTDNVNGTYQPVLTTDGKLISSSFTADGYRLREENVASLLWKQVVETKQENSKLFKNNSLAQTLSNPALDERSGAATKYKKTTNLFNFHSGRPSYNASEYSYTLYGDNVLSTLRSELSYTYNRNERSSAIGYQATFAGVLPFVGAGVEYTYNRNIDTAVGRGINFNSAKANVSAYVPLRFVGGRTFKNLVFGGGYNIEQIPYLGIGKNVLQNDAFKYVNAFISFANQSRQARQNINPRWAQTVSVNYRKGFNYFESGKFLGRTSLFFPGLFRNHSLELNGAFQKRDSVPDFFSNNFPYARGYEALNTRQMYKLGANYHFPLLYPDLGVGNIFFLRRIRANAFFDYNVSRARFRGVLTDIINRSVGGELFFDGQIWNSLPGGIGIRYSRLLDTDLQNPRAKGVWAIVLPLNLIPN